MKINLTTRPPDSTWRLIPHAEQRCDEMSVSEEEILDVLADPDLDYPGRNGPDGDPRRLAVAGRLAIVYSPARHQVITVLWAGREGRAAAA